ncbi:MAG: SDR family oxidoreductase [Bacteroidota bacterium]
MNQSPFNLNNKTFLVTGASSGIGRETAIVLSKFGANIILLARNLDRLEETKSRLINTSKHVVISADLSDFEKLDEIITKIKDSSDKINGVVHCAGISSTLVLRSIKYEKLQDHFNINVNAGILLTKLLLSKKYALFDEGGSIVFISSVMGLVGEAGKTAYSMTKGALIAGSKSLAIELAPKKIRVNTISPGVVITPMSSSSFYSKDEERLEKIKSLHPLGLGDVEDIANSCVYLLSDASKWVTGTNLIVDGGYTAK